MGEETEQVGLLVCFSSLPVGPDLAECFTV